MNDDANKINADSYRMGNSKTVTSESFKYNIFLIFLEAHQLMIIQ